MKKVVLSIGAAAIIVLAAINVNIALKSERISKSIMVSIVALADNENPGSGENGNSEKPKCGATSKSETYRSITIDGVEYPTSYVVAKSCIDGSGRSCESGVQVTDLQEGTTTGTFTTVTCPLFV